MNRFKLIFTKFQESIDSTKLKDRLVRQLPVNYNSHVHHLRTRKSHNNFQIYPHYHESFNLWVKLKSSSFSFLDFLLFYSKVVKRDFQIVQREADPGGDKLLGDKSQDKIPLFSYSVGKVLHHHSHWNSKAAKLIDFIIERLCATSQVYYSESSKSVSCEYNCATQTKCGDYIVIPEEHLDVSNQCTDESLFLFKIAYFKRFADIAWTRTTVKKKATRTRV